MATRPPPAKVKESLAAYKVVVRDAYGKAPLDLSNFDGRGSDVLDFLRAHLESLKRKVFDDQDTSTQLHTSNVQYLEVAGQRARTLLGTVITGNYGQASTFRDSRKPVDAPPSFRRRPHHTEERPFHFRAHFPAAPVPGLLLTQMSGQYGIKTSFWSKSFKAAFKERWPEHMMDIEHWYPEPVWEQYADRGTLFGVSATLDTVPPDVATSFGVPLNLAKYVELEIRLRGKRGVRFKSPFPLNLRAGRAGKRSALSVRIEDTKLELSNWQFEMQLDEKQITVKLADETAPRASYVIPDPQYDEDYATFESVQDFAEELEVLLGQRLWGS